jgi:L-lactate dehydrogenase
VLVNRTREWAAGVVTDMGYGHPLSPPVDLSDGDYDDLAGADLVMITVGENEQSGGATDRADRRPPPVAGQKRDLYRDVVPRIVQAAPDAVCCGDRSAGPADRYRERAGRP